MNNFNNENNNEENNLDFYMKPFEEEKQQKIIDVNAYNSNNDDDYNNEISKYSLKEKMKKISLSIEILNYNFKKKFDFKQIEKNFESNLNKNNLILNNNLLDIIIELICQIKSAVNSKEEILEKFNNLLKYNNDYESKIKNLKKETLNKQKEINSLINKFNLDKEKITKNNKNNNQEICELKTENKKMTNLISLYKNEIRKRENEHQKIQEKFKYLVTKANNNILYKNTFDIVNNLSNQSYTTKEEQVLVDEVNFKNYEKNSLTLSNNKKLFSLLTKVNKYLNKYFLLINSFDGNQNKYEEIGDGAFNNNFFEEKTSDIFLSNMEIIHNNIINYQKQNLYNKMNNKYQKNINKTNNIVSISNIPNSNNNKNNDDKNVDNEKKSIWFEHCINKEISCKFDENNVIKNFDSDDNNNDNINE